MVSNFLFFLRMPKEANRDIAALVSKKGIKRFWRVVFGHVSGFLQRRLDYFFISNNIQEFILDTDIIPAISSDHSPILISFSKEKQDSKSSAFWKFNNSLLSDNIFKEKLKQHIQNIESDNELSNDPQIKWEFLKYQIRKFTIRFSKTRAKEERKQRDELETTLNHLKETFRLRKISVFMINVKEISKKYMIILRKEHASEAGVSGMKKVKNPLNFS